MLDKLSNLICTSFGIGYLTKFPGTLASFIILFPFWILKESFNYYSIVLLLSIFIFLSFYFVSQEIKKLEDKDPKHIIIDEYIGQAIALMFCDEKIIHYILAFLLFRLFDIIKPFPISYFDKLKNAFGLIMDDILAGFFAGIIIYVIILWL